MTGEEGRFVNQPYGLFSTAGSTVASGTTTALLVDYLGNLQIVGAQAANASTIGINPILMAGVDAAGSLKPLNTTSGTLKVDTELLLSADNITISNVKTFVDPTGTQTFAGVDASTRIILAPTSTIAGITGTLNLASTISIYPLTSASTVTLSTTSTVSVSGTAVLSTTSTVPTSFAITSTVQVAGTIGQVTTIGSTVSINIAVASTVIPVLTDSAGTAQYGLVDASRHLQTDVLAGTINYLTTTSTLPVSGTVTTVGSGGTMTLSTTSTIPVSFATTSSIGASISTTSTYPVSFATTSTIEAIASTVDINIASAAVMTPTDAQAVYQSAVSLWSSTNLVGAGTLTAINSAAVDISTYITKAAAIYVTVASTMIIQTAPTSATATWYDYRTNNNVATNTYTVESFTEPQYWSRLSVTSSGAGTLSAWLIGQVG